MKVMNLCFKSEFSLRSQSGPGAGSFLSVPPTNLLVRFDFALPYPFVSADVSSGFLGGSKGSLESVAACVCREGGARVTTNMFVRDLDLHVPNAARDGRCQGVQLAIDTTLVFPRHSNGTAWQGCRRP